MKGFPGFCKRSSAALFAASAVLISAIPADAAVDNKTDKLSILDDNNIPVVYLNIDENADGFSTLQEMNESEDHSAKCTGTVRIDVPDGYKGDYSNIALEDTDELQLEYIRGRGNFTWRADKKPYKFKLEKKADLLGMGKNKHWALLANRYDGSMLRNRLAMYMGSRLGLEYTPQMLPVDLVINGEYSGSYFLSETVRIGKSRVDIDELSPGDNEGENLTGGYLLSLDTMFVEQTSFENRISTDKGIHFICEEPEFYSEDGGETGTAQQKQYIQNFIYSAEDAIYSDGFTNSSGQHYSDLIDIRSAADFWWMQELLINHDAFDTTSNYLYKKRGGKLYFGPLWDFDYTMGFLERETKGFNHSPFPWLDHLREKDPDFQQLLRERWKTLNEILTDVLKKDGILDQFAAEQINSAKDDSDRWGTCTNAHRTIEDFETEVGYIREWLTERQKWINDNIDDSLTRTDVTVTFMADGQEIASSTLAGGERISELPTPPEIEGLYFMDWRDEFGRTIRSGDRIGYDMVLTARYYDPFSPPDFPDEPEFPEYPDDPDDPDPPERPKEPDEPEDPDPGYTDPGETDPQDRPEPINEPSSGGNTSDDTGANVSTDSSDSRSPETGDSEGYSLLMLISAVSLGAAFAVRKKNKS